MALTAQFQLRFVIATVVSKDENTPTNTTGLLVVMAALKLGWLYAYILMNKTLPADMASKRTAKLIARGAVVIFLSYLGAGAIALLMRLDALEMVVFIMLETLIIGGALFATLQLILEASKLRVSHSF